MLGVGAAALGSPETARLLLSARPGVNEAASLSASVGHRAGDLTLGNAAINALWSVADGRLRAVRIDAPAGRETLALSPNVFALTLADGTTLASSDLRLTRDPAMGVLRADSGASRLAERQGGRQVTALLRDEGGRLEVSWRAVLRDGSRYVRQEVTLRALGEPLSVRDVILVDARAAGARVIGSVRGSPGAVGNWYAGFEHPLSRTTVEADRLSSALPRELPLRPGSPVTVSSVIGIARTGQLRRDFLAYLERERAHPYRTFLHYNSWYDIGYFSKYSEPDALAVIAAFGAELRQKRGVMLSSFLFDDGWDDPQTLWGFHAGFPQGFERLRQEAGKFGAAPGVWMSPWGGYGQPKQDRLRFGQAQGFETNRGGFALSGPKYYQRFHDTCLEFIRKYGINQFKFDGTGNASNAIPGSAFDSDFDAAIALIGDLRVEKPDLFVNLTTGTYPSPFWLRYADSIWRGGEDHSFAGVGSDRQQWMTYRDADTYQRVVQRGPLYPLNSLMLHGLIYAQHAKKLDTDPQNDFNSEVRAYFGNGTHLQEMYVTPSRLTAGNWDTLAESANWSRRNAGTLVDTHWVGGDPARLEPYGWAAWSAGKGTLTLRNPGDRPQSLALDVATAFELPDDAPRRYLARSPWASGRGSAQIVLTAGSEHAFALAPFEVLTLEAVPG